MALSGEPATLGSLVRDRHYVGCLLSYFLAPRTAWGLHSEDVIHQVLKENRMHNERRWNEAASSLRKCLNQRAKLWDELDAINKALEVTPASQSHLEMEVRVHTIHTALSAMENSIAKFKNSIEECQMLEDESARLQRGDRRHRDDRPRGAWCSRVLWPPSGG